MILSSSSRRGFLGLGLGLGLSAVAGRALSAEMFPVVETTHGRLRGFMSGDIAAFKGIRYGAPTSGANRFMPPQPVETWAGVKDCFAYSEVSPQVPADRRSAYGDLIMFDLQPSGPGEDCLGLNLWSPNLSDSANAPVIVVLHGGGFYGGSGNSVGMDGEMMARFSGSVVISVTHRLGAFGFLHLAEQGGDDFASSGAVGMMDIVAALRWIKDNVAQFGGDPDRVLVYGQSGGGAKTSVLLAMPSARGLMHRAGVMSGSALKVMSPDAATAQANALLTELGIGKGDIRALQNVPWLTILKAQSQLEANARSRGEAPGSFAPVLDGIAIPHHPFDPDAPAVSAEVPMIISSVLDERSYRMADFNMTEEGLVAFARSRARDRAEEVVRLYREEDAKARPFLIAARMDSDLMFRRAAFMQAELKAQQGAAPVWTYLWTWPSPALDGRFGAVHGIDVAPALHSIRGALNGPNPSSIAMAGRAASMWAAFAANGNPNNPRLPEWAAYDQARRQTLILDDNTRVEDDPRRQFRLLWDELRPGLVRSIG